MLDPADEANDSFIVLRISHTKTSQDALMPPIRDSVNELGCVMRGKTGLVTGNREIGPGPPGV